MMKTRTAVRNGKLDARNPHVRFEEKEVASEKTRQGSLLYKYGRVMLMGVVICSLFAFGNVYAEDVIESDGLKGRWLIRTGRDGGAQWRYLETQNWPADWISSSFNDASWNSGLAGFGNGRIEADLTRTAWRGGDVDIFLRKKISFPEKMQDVQSATLWFCVDDSFEMWVNNESVFKQPRHYTGGYLPVDITDLFKRTFKDSGRENIIAVRAQDFKGASFIDIGIQMFVSASAAKEAKNDTISEKPKKKSAVKRVEAEVKCKKCNGTGKIMEDCMTCHGSKYVWICFDSKNKNRYSENDYDRKDDGWCGYGSVYQPIHFNCGRSRKRVWCPDCKASKTTSSGKIACRCPACGGNGGKSQQSVPDGLDRSGEVLRPCVSAQPSMGRIDACASSPVASIIAGMVGIAERNFYISKVELTQRQWTAVMGHNPSVFIGQDRPVDSVSYDDAVEFVARLNECPEAKRCPLIFRLPHDSEWMFVAHSRSENENGRRGEFAWYQENSGGETHDVATRLPNAYGVYDMWGNVWEWTDRLSNGKGQRRGASFTGGEGDFGRSIHTPSGRRYNDCGFRLAADRKDGRPLMNIRKNAQPVVLQRPTEIRNRDPKVDRDPEVKTYSAAEIEKMVEEELEYDREMFKKKFTGKAMQ